VVREIAKELESQGAKLNFMPIVRGALDYMDGQADALSAGLEESIRAGFRMPPGNLTWMTPMVTDSAEAARLARRMHEVLAAERARYEAASAAPQGPAD
jgi:hypothetical protein